MTNKSKTNEQTMPDVFLKFIETMNQSNQPNPLQAIGAGFSGFAAPFLGQQWANPYAETQGTSLNDILTLAMLGQFAPGSTEPNMPQPTDNIAAQKALNEFVTSAPIEAPSVSGYFKEQYTQKSPFGTATYRDIYQHPLMKSKLKAREKWDTEAAQRAIKFEVLTPKLMQYMNVGGRAYKELRNVAKQYGIDLNFEKGGIQALKTMATKKAAMALKMAPLMTALERLRPELGTELMRQLGAFRSGTMAKRFENTLAQFSGDIREDIANMVTTIAKNKANVELLDKNGKVISPEEKERRLNAFEANLIRKYNYMYRNMGLTTKPYTAERSFEWLAKNSTFNKGEERIIQNAMKDNPKYTREQVVGKLIEKGIL